MGTVSTVTIDLVDYHVYALTANAVTDAGTYWSGRMGAGATAWAAASADEKAQALIMASDWIDRASDWTGSKTTAAQPREWPRDNATNQCTGESITSGTVPDALATATFWLAGQILVDPTIVDSSGEGSNVKKAKAGSAEVTFFTPTIGGASDVRLPTVAHDYLKCYLSSGTSIITPSGTGDDDDSYFGPGDWGII